jgi:hypothetical protein
MVWRKWFQKGYLKRRGAPSRRQSGSVGEKSRERKKVSTKRSFYCSKQDSAATMTGSPTSQLHSGCPPKRRKSSIAQNSQ